MGSQYTLSLISVTLTDYLVHVIMPCTAIMMNVTSVHRKRLVPSLKPCATHTGGHQINNQSLQLTRYAFEHQHTVIEDYLSSSPKMPVDKSASAPRQSCVLTFSKPTPESFEAALPTLKEESRQYVPTISISQECRSCTC
jgi:hypothetical protein